MTNIYFLYNVSRLQKEDVHVFMSPRDLKAYMITYLHEFTRKTISEIDNELLENDELRVHERNIYQMLDVFINYVPERSLLALVEIDLFAFRIIRRIVNHEFLAYEIDEYVNQINDVDGLCILFAQNGRYTTCDFYESRNELLDDMYTKILDDGYRTTAAFVITPNEVVREF